VVAGLLAEVEELQQEMHVVAPRLDQREPLESNIKSTRAIRRYK
jgi:hypothetical protein